MLDSINREQGLYVLKSGTGFSCLGFDVAFSQAVAVADWLSANGVSCPAPVQELKGTEEGYADYERVMEIGRSYNQISGKRCPAELTPELVGLEGKRVEVVGQDGEKRRFWVGKSGRI